MTQTQLTYKQLKIAVLGYASTDWDIHSERDVV